MGFGVWGLGLRGPPTLGGVLDGFLPPQNAQGVGGRGGGGGGGRGFYPGSFSVEAPQARTATSRTMLLALRISVWGREGLRFRVQGSGLENLGCREFRAGASQCEASTTKGRSEHWI